MISHMLLKVINCLIDNNIEIRIYQLGISGLGFNRSRYYVTKVGLQQKLAVMSS